MPRVLLIRHAPTAETGKTLTGRLPGIALDEEGRQVAGALAVRLERTALRAIYSSPIERTWETAQAIAVRQRCEPTAHDGLMEVDYGDWSGRSLASLRRLKTWKTVQVAPSRMRFPGGETLLEAQARAVATVEEIARGHRRATVACVTHADIIKAVLSHYLGQPLDLFQRIVITPGSISEVVLEPGSTPIVATVNSRTGTP